MCALGNNNSLFASRCHFRVDVFHRFLLSVFQVFYSAEPTYPITAKYLRILSPENQGGTALNPPYIASTWANTHLKQYEEKLVRPLTI